VAGELADPGDVDDVAAQLLAPLFFDYLFGTGSVDDDLAIEQADRVFEALTSPAPLRWT
jgi:hypothetical protein